MDEYEHILEKASSFLISQQCSDGSFESFLHGSGSIEIESPNAFCTFLALSALAPARAASSLATVRERGLAFTRGEAGAKGSYNYWKSAARARAPQRYPDDLDDTALAYAARIACGETLPASALAQLATLLPAAEIAEGGPYQTWLVDLEAHSDWRDVDVAVNANIAYLLSLLGIRLPNLDAYLERAVIERRFVSRYYHDPLVILYFIARGYAGSKFSEIHRSIDDIRREDGTFGNPLRDALAISSMVRVGATRAAYEAPLRLLLESQEKDGGWVFTPFYIGRMEKGKISHAGSRALTTACVIEALSLASNASALVSKSRLASGNYARSDDSFERILRACRTLSPAAGAVTEAYASYFRADSFWSGIIALPFDSARALDMDARSASIASIADAHRAGLIGYTLLDAITDGEHDTALAPCAAYLIRRCYSGYRAALGGAQSRSVTLVERELASMESFMLRESAARLRRAADGLDLSTLPASSALPLSAKSIGVALPALVLLAAREIPACVVRSCRTYFVGLLDARQWNDDAHDIIEDISRGRLTRANCSALALFAKHHPRRPFNPAYDARELGALFWRESFSTVCAAIEAALISARAALADTPYARASAFTDLLKCQEESLARARREHTNALAFLSTYRTNHTATSSVNPR